MYIEPKVDSSYKENNLGKTLYELVLEYKPGKIIEFGVLYGYSIISMAEALKDLGGGEITGYDLFEAYQYNHANLNDTLNTIKAYGVQEYITLKRKNFDDWLNDPEDFDLMHIDLSNTGDSISKALAVLDDFLENGSVVVFEGGTPERDQVEWMLKYDMTPIFSLKKQLGYEIIDARFPGLSLIDRRR